MTGSGMNGTPKRPVQPWIPPQRPRPVPQKVLVRTKAPSAAGPLRAGWIYTGVTAGLKAVVLFLRGDIAFIIDLLLLYLIYAGAIVILVLSIIAMVRGAALKGMLLLVGAPVAVWGLSFLTVAVARQITKPSVAEHAKREQKTSTDQTRPAPAAAESLKRAQQILLDAQSMLRVRDDALFEAARNNAFAQAAGANLLEEDREMVRRQLEAMFDGAARMRKLQSLR